jgi:glycosyltransferase involved in cell wall biosynthesis
MALYTAAGRRSTLPPLVFGAGVLWELVRRGRRYDVVHTCSFPYFSVLAAGLARPLGRYRLAVDWHEVWTDEYWRDYLGGVAGRLGAWVQRRCARVPQRAFCFSRLHGRRVRALGLRGPLTVLTGELENAPTEPPRIASGGGPPTVVFAGRHIPEKRVPALVDAVAWARRELPELRAEIYGDGPERADVLRRIRAHGLEGAVSAPGFVAADAVEVALRRADCMALPSAREGYGLVVLEAASRATPSVVVAGPDNAAVELVVEGESGFIAPSPAPADLGAAILRAVRGGEALRRSTAAWFERNARTLSLDSSLDRVASAYAEGVSARR